MSYNNNHILKVKDLSVWYTKYGNSVQAIDNITINGIEEGSWVFITGDNGSGKSTFLKTIAKKTHNYTGNIEVDGNDIRQTGTKELSKKVFLLTQNPSTSTVEELTVWENLIFATEGKTTEDFKKSLKETGLTEHKNHLVKYLSGGQRQLLALQIAQLRDVSILMLDEPFTSLDPDNVKKGMEVVLKLWKRGITILFVTHDMEMLNHRKIKGYKLLIFEKGNLLNGRKQV